MRGYIIVLIIVMFAGTASADTLHVPANHTSIQGAIDSAEPGDTIHISKKVYSEHITINKPLTLLGDHAMILGREGRDVVTVSADGVTVSGFMIEGGMAGVSILASSEIIIENNRISNNIYGIYMMNADNAIIMDNMITNNKDHGIYMENASNNIIVENLVMLNCGDGIRMEQSTDNVIIDNVLPDSSSISGCKTIDLPPETGRAIQPLQATDNTTKTGTTNTTATLQPNNTVASNLTIAGSTIDYDGIDVDVVGEDAVSNTHSICLIQSSGNVIQADVIKKVSLSQLNDTIIDADQLPVIEHATTVVAQTERIPDNTGNGTGNITDQKIGVCADGDRILYVPTDYLTIQSAIGAATNGDTVYVYNGTYTENLVVDKMITLHGEDRCNTVIDGNGGNVVYINSPHVNISGFTIRNGVYGIYVVGVFMVGRDCRITDCTMHSNRNGIFLGSSCRDNIIYDCILHSNTDHGILLFMACSNNRITDCTAYSNGKTGIALQKSCGNNTIENCNVTSNQQTGISLFQVCNNNTITNCSAISNPQNGISASMASSGNQITNCVVQDSFAGILISHASAGNMVAGCDSSESTNGIQISHASAANRVVCCNTPENTNGISISHASTENTIQDCDTGSNLQRGIFIAMASKENKIMNCVIGSAQHGMLITRSSTGNTINGSTVGTTSLYDFMVEYASSGTVIETTFDTASVRLASTLTVKNYLDVLVLNGADTNPIQGADVSVTDEGQAIYASEGYGGTDPATDPAGLCGGILVTDRIYRSNVATENTTLVSVKHCAWEESDRDVSMFESHTEIFTKPAT
ncbi:MAG: hypothetical protein EF813_03000 [Methanosarcinales archaeon]|nr:MAG: hypothetical protein EF813_03000 [Methanosarcinales archaeon]